MYRYFKLIIISTLCVSFLFCNPKNRSNTNQNQPGIKSKKETSKNKPSVVNQRIAPNTCRFIGTIVSIDPTLKSKNPADPCAKAPCLATVRIDSVLGYGSAFPTPLSKGKEIRVTFKFTTAPTKEILPNLTESYPGVREGSTFFADLDAHQEPAIGKETGGIFYTVYGYKIK